MVRISLANFREQTETRNIDVDRQKTPLFLNVQLILRACNEFEAYSLETTKSSFKNGTSWYYVSTAADLLFLPQQCHQLQHIS